MTINDRHNLHESSRAQTLIAGESAGRPEHSPQGSDFLFDLSGGVLTIINEDGERWAACDRCYVTGPHFGGDIYSGTADIAEATRYDIETARKLAATKWRDARPLVIEVED